MIDKVSLDFLLFLQSFGCMGLFLSPFDFITMGFSPLCQSSACLGLPVPIFGLVRIGPVFLLPVVEALYMGSSLSLRSFSRLDSALPVFDYSNFDFFLLSRSVGQLGFGLPALGLARVGPVSLLPVVDATKLGLLLPVRSPS